MAAATASRGTITSIWDVGELEVPSNGPASAVGLMERPSRQRVKVASLTSGPASAVGWPGRPPSLRRDVTLMIYMLPPLPIRRRGDAKQPLGLQGRGAFKAAVELMLASSPVLHRFAFCVCLRTAICFAIHSDTCGARSLLF